MRPDRGKSARQLRRDEIGQTLLEALESLVTEGESYTSLSVERIARAASVSRATFYIYFEGKPGLMQSWLASVLDKFVAASTAWRQLGPSSTRDDVCHAVTDLVAAYRRHAQLLRAAAVEASQDRLVRAQIDEALEAATAGLAQQLQRGQREGWVDASLTLPEAASWAVCMLERGLDGLPQDVGDDHLHQLTEALGVLAWNSFFARARSTGLADAV